MFRPVPPATVWRKIPSRSIAIVVFILALVVSVMLLFTLEREKLLVEGLMQGGTLPTEVPLALWRSRRDVMLVAGLVFLVSAIAIGAIITFLYYDSARRTLEEVKGLARNILRSIPAGILTVNHSGIITAVNPAAEQILGRPSSDLLGHRYDIVFAEGDPVRLILDEAVKESRHVGPKDVFYERGDQPARIVRMNTTELSGDDDKPVGVLLQAHDVTEWLALERRVQAAEKLAALHTLSAGVAHELRNPLSAVDLNLHLLEEELKERGVLAGQEVRYLHILNAECRRLSAILDNFMKLARSGSISLHEVDVKALIDHVVALMKFEAEERKIRLERSVEPGLPLVLGDETQITQVLVNIIVNAFHAMPNGGFCQIAAAKREADGSAWLEIAVKDNGVGITKDQMPHLFEPFYTTKTGGTGLGLAIAYRIVQDHGGTIRISSASGSGTSVVMRLPAAHGRLREGGIAP
ncbi:MAG: PAS domain-containing protein [Nitrospira sp.]|nr:PAS domain-containing protein [Nitrospira sp.]